MQARAVAAMLASLVYLFISYWLMAHAAPSGWNIVGVLGPMLLLIASGCWRSGHRALGTVAGAGLIVLCLQALLGAHIPPRRLYLAQHIGIDLFLAFGFGSTLRAGQTALITLIARRVHALPLPPAHVRYTRRLTFIWAGYFVAMAATSAILFTWASFETWALFANLLEPISLGILFVGEHLLRYRLHPEFERSSLLAQLRASLQARPTAPAPQHDPAA